VQDLNVIETPENVELSQPLAGIGSRFLAGFIDNLIMIGVFIVLIILFVLTTWENPIDFFRSSSERYGFWASAILIILAFLVYWGYFLFFEWRTNGQTPGKRYMKLRVVKEGGLPVTFTDIAVRNLLRVVDGQISYAVAGVFMFASSKAQRLGDMAAGTVVISEEMPNYSARSDKYYLSQAERPATAEGLRATGLTPEEYRVLWNYWYRRNQLTFEARQRVLPKILAPILQRAGQELVDHSVMTMENYVADILSRATTSEQSAASAPQWPEVPR
jgi:uncharacterized RDD family membrane protein YckC